MKTAIIENISLDKKEYIYWEDKNIELSFSVKFNKEKAIKNIRIEYWVIFQSYAGDGFDHTHFVKLWEKVLREKFTSYNFETISFKEYIPILYGNITTNLVWLIPYIKIIVDVDWSLFDINEIIKPKIVYSISDCHKYHSKIFDSSFENASDEYVNLNIYNFWPIFSVLKPIFKWDLVKKSIINKLIKKNTLLRYYHFFLLSNLTKQAYYLAIILLISLVILNILPIKIDWLKEISNYMFIFLLGVIFIVFLLKLVFPYYLKKKILTVELNTNLLNFRDKLEKWILTLWDIFKKFKINVSENVSYQLDVYLICYVQTYHKRSTWSGKNRRVETIRDVSQFCGIKVFDIKNTGTVDLFSKPIERNYKQILEKMPSSFIDWFNSNKIYYKLEIDFVSKDLPDFHNSIYVKI